MVAAAGPEAGGNALRPVTHGELGPPQAGRHLLSDARPDPVRREGHPPAPAHPHERQAARAGGEQARALLRDRGDGGGRHRGGRDHHRPRDRRGDPRGGRRRLGLRHLRSSTSSRTSRSGWRTPLLTAEPFLGQSPFVMYLGDNLLRDGIVDLVDTFRTDEPDALILLTPGARPRALRRGRAERRPRGAAGREAEGAPRPTSRSWASTCSRRRSSTRPARSSRPGAASSRSPTRSRRSWTAACAWTRTSCTAGGRTPARCRTCSRPTS